VIPASEARKRLDQLVESGDPFASFGADAIMDVLPFEQAKDMLKDGVTPEAWEESTNPYTEEGVIACMRDYMGFAWEKTTDHRGLSAVRSVMRYREWLWILGDADLVATCENPDTYPMYGAPVLKAICEKYGFDVPDNERARRMARGEPCRPDCDEGCG